MKADSRNRSFVFVPNEVGPKCDVQFFTLVYFQHASATEFMSAGYTSGVVLFPFKGEGF